MKRCLLNCGLNPRRTSKQRTIMCSLGVQLVVAACGASLAAEDWIKFADESYRIVADASGESEIDDAPCGDTGMCQFAICSENCSAACACERDIAFADLDGDGDIDMVMVRKVPFSNQTGKGVRINCFDIDRTSGRLAAWDDRHVSRSRGLSTTS